MTDPEFLEKLMRYQDGVLTPAEIETLERVLGDEPGRRRQFADLQMCSMALHDQFRQEAYRLPQSPPVRGRWKALLAPRPALAAAAGLVIGLFGASVVWAISTPDWVSTTSRVAGLGDADFEESPAALIEQGFPRLTGRWSGDEAEIIDLGTTAGGRKALRFISPGADATVPGGRAISCDVFQLVDLRSLGGVSGNAGESIMELSASFLDNRAPGVESSVTFMVQIFLFSGDPAAIHESWPNNLGEALGSGSAFVHTRGAAEATWHRITAKCLVPPEADFAVIQLAARPNLRPAVLESLYVDKVELTLKSRPDLPIRVLK